MSNVKCKIKPSTFQPGEFPNTLQEIRSAFRVHARAVFCRRRSAADEDKRRSAVRTLNETGKFGY